jgi:hypothetical protein
MELASGEEPLGLSSELLKSFIGSILRRDQRGPFSFISANGGNGDSSQKKVGLTTIHTMLNSDWIQTGNF